MTPKERIAAALAGGKPDRLPVMTIYDIGYMYNCTGRDIREAAVGTTAAYDSTIEGAFLRHDLDGFVVPGGFRDDATGHLTVEKFDDYWRITDTRDGNQWGVLPDGNQCDVDGTTSPRQRPIDEESLITCETDIAKHALPQPTESEIEERQTFRPMKKLSAKYPDHHFSFQTASPMPRTIDACGGYVQGLTTMATNPKLFCKILEHYTVEFCNRMALARRCGAESTWFTCYLTGADTISPKDYAELIFPYELEICREAKRNGLYVLNWYLGDLMPNLDKVMELPIDALVLEQGRKTYEIDPVEIRRRVGSDFCLFGYAYENDFCTFNKDRLKEELLRQYEGAGIDGAFVVGTPIMPPNANPDAVDFYFNEARKLGGMAITTHCVTPKRPSHLPEILSRDEIRLAHAWQR